MVSFHHLGSLLVLFAARTVVLAGEVSIAEANIMHAADTRPINGVGRDKRAAIDFVNYGGPVLSGPTVAVYLIYYGPGFTCATTKAVEQFFRDVNNSNWVKVLSQYAGFTTVTFGASRAISSSVYGTAINDTTLQVMIKASIAGKYFPLTSQALYFVYTGTGISVEGNPKQYACSYYCGYHWVFEYSSVNVAYGIGSIDTACITGNTCGGTSGALNVMTTVGSHELAEAITDPQEGYGSGYYGWGDKNSGGEIADICGLPTNVTLQTGGYSYMVESLHSNANGGCTVIHATSLTTATSLVPVGSSISVSWTAPVGSSTTDWIGIYTCSTTSTSDYVVWESTKGATSGTYLVPASDITSAGCYIFYYFKNDGWVIAASSQNVTVVSETTLQAAVSSTGGGASGGGNILVNWAAVGTLHKKDWIAIYPTSDSTLEDSVEGEYDWYIYTNGAPYGQAVIPYVGEGSFYVYYLPNDLYVWQTWIEVYGVC